MKYLVLFIIDGYVNYVKIIGNRIVLGFGENLNLMVLCLYQFKICGDEEGNEVLLYDGFLMEVMFGDF